jgi:hypothetical protein
MFGDEADDETERDERDERSTLLGSRREPRRQSYGALGWFRYEVPRRYGRMRYRGAEMVQRPAQRLVEVRRVRNLNLVGGRACAVRRGP